MSETKNGNEKKRQIVRKLINEITSHNNNFSLFRQEEAIDSYSLDQIRASARKEGLKIIFIPNRILRVALNEKNFENENLNLLLKKNNFIVLSKDSIKSTTLSDCIKDKKLKSKIQLKAIILQDHLIQGGEKMQLLIQAKSEKGIKIMMMKTLRNSLVKLIRTLHFHHKQLHS